MQQYSSTFIFSDTTYFFSYSQLIDYYIGKEQPHSMQLILNQLEEQKIHVEALLCLFSMLCRQNKDGDVVVDDQGVIKLIENDGVKLLWTSLSRLLQKMQQKDSDGLNNEMSLKIIINNIYLCLDYLERNPTNSQSSKELNQVYHHLHVDELLMKMVSSSLQAHYIPVKKLTMLYTKVLSNIFHHGASQQSSVNPKTIFDSVELSILPQNNLLRTNELQHIKNKQPLKNPHEKLSPVEQFYRKHNTGECPLAQSIVVGLLRSLLTICNCQMHKKFTTTKGGGVDSFREWQLSYRWLLAKSDLLAHLPVMLINRLESYELFDHQPTQDSELWSEFYSHKIYTTASITTFFFVLLVAFKHNQFLQYSYFLQLISDANGILVFLKFLTDKFISLDNIIENPVYSNGKGTDPSFGFKEKTMLTIYSVLLMLYTSCNNYPQKIRNYLFQYNSYLIIKKIPALFMGKENRLRISTNEEPSESSGTSSLPSRKQLEDLERERGGAAITVLKKLTELCFDLLKIQVPFFSKKMKENSANMRLIIDLYCKFPKDPKPIILNHLDKLFLKNKCGLEKQEKYITSVEEMKTVHNDYNNQFYWTNDFLQEQAPPSARILENISPLIDPTTWLEQNMWKYYD